jgi:GNAT superfamily N-acetyltransferase
VGPDDYVISRLDETIRKKHLFLVFSKKGDLIGMSNFTPVFDKSGWLGMARTDPEWRGRGIAQFVQRSIASYARKKGIKALRFFVLSTNTSSIRAAKKGGFRVVAHGTHITCDLKKVKIASRDQIKVKLAPCLVNLNQILHSNYLSKMNGYLGYGYAFVRGNRANLLLIKNKEELFCYGKSSFILTTTEKDYEEFFILTGKVRDTLLKILKVSRELGAKAVGGFLPYDYHMRRVSRTLGFKEDSWGKHLILFEKRI